MFSKIGFIGAGQMAKAIGLSMVRKGVVKPSEVFVSCPEEQYLEAWKEVGCRTTIHNGEVVDDSDTIIWAVKPQIFNTALQSTEYNVDNTSKFHVSIMAGIPLLDFTKLLQLKFKSSKISTARAMPNIAMKVDCGCSVYTMDEATSSENKELLSKLLGSVGLCFEVPEHQINAYCGLFSSGIGFMFPILEGLSDGAVNMGIPRDLSLQIAAQTMKGAAQLILGEGNSHPGALKDSVCSPGGTTIRGIAQLEFHSVRYALMKAVEAATTRGEELGMKSKK
ncbi:pyrroline-5-carboxylate reductase 3 isoform X2 [Folsomia candida]|uniref:pyrroline-5-carboxylate reductase 3 isoform X2 n=1 Tax=Folsomia candida TaxID=158441 RepID=UPI000B909528|nr:pyrroline-5-carboxylate reductase 3 isoform X2 [Folsomia candida]